MNLHSSQPDLSDSKVSAILDWLALAHGRHGSDDAEQLLGHLLRLREAIVPSGQRIKILDLVLREIERMVFSEIPRLLEVSLPVTRKVRQRVRILQDLLDSLAQEYFNSLAGLFDPQGKAVSLAPQTALAIIIRCLSWHIRISHLVAAPHGIGIWQKIHAAFNSARQLGIHELPATRDMPSLQTLYSSTLLTAIAQPASFSARELEFIVALVETRIQPVTIADLPPPGFSCLFWVDVERDFPAHALVRRLPPGDVPIFFLSGDEAAQQVREFLSQLENGATAASLGLPHFADSHAGRGVLRRLKNLWGHPTKRKFPRRKQSYRVKLCFGLEPLWRLTREPESDHETSEWMVTNESPDGYALMHMSGQTSNVRVGDIVAVQTIERPGQTSFPGHICIVRWALSENPEHVELGLQQLASRAIAAELARPFELDAKHIAALILPEMPPLRLRPGLVVQTGALPADSRKLLLLIEQENLQIREVRPTQLTEQTMSIEVFNVEPDPAP
jgi:hypothetical protein